MCNVVTVSTGNKWETAKWLDSIYGWWQKGWDKHKSHLQFQKPVTHAQLRKPNLATRMWSQFDGIGWDKAKALGKALSEVEDVVSADREDLMTVEGIGPKLADSIIKQRRE